MMTYTKIEELIFRYLSGSSTDIEVKQLNQWLDESVENEKIFIALKKAFTEVQAHFSDPMDAGMTYQKFLERIEYNYKPTHYLNLKRFYSFLRYASVIILLIATGATAYMIGKQRTQLIPGKGVQIDVPLGSTSSITLPDGSSVWLNAGSRLTYDQDFNAESRDTYLVGEALFNVEKRDVPFIVHTSHMDVHVTGTTFNVKSYPDEDRIEATVVEGEVRIETLAKSSPIYIKPNQKLQYHKSLQRAEVVSDVKLEKTTNEQEEPSRAKTIVLYDDVDAEEIISWQSGILHIEGEKLIDLVRKLERKFDVRFQFEDEVLKEYTYSGTILDLPLEQVLEAIKLTSPVDYEVKEKTVELTLNQKFNGKS